MAGLTPQDARPYLEFSGPQDAGDTSRKDIISSYPCSDDAQGNLDPQSPGSQKAHPLGKWSPNTYWL